MSVMAPTTSDAPGDGRGPPLHDEDGIERRTIQGHDAVVSLAPDRISVEWRTAHPVFYGVQVDDRLKDADADVSSPRIDEWVVTHITPTEVVGEHSRTGAERRFERERVERGLVVGNYATTLSGFPRVSVHTVGSWEAYDPDADDTDRTYRGRPYVTVVAHGDNGRTYGLRYRSAEASPDSPIALWEEDTTVSGLEDHLRDRLNAAVEAALTAAGHTLA